MRFLPSSMVERAAACYFGRATEKLRGLVAVSRDTCSPQYRTPNRQGAIAHRVRYPLAHEAGGGIQHHRCFGSFDTGSFFRLALCPYGHGPNRQAAYLSHRGHGLQSVIQMSLWCGPSCRRDAPQALGKVCSGFPHWSSNHLWPCQNRFVHLSTCKACGVNFGHRPSNRDQRRHVACH